MAVGILKSIEDLLQGKKTYLVALLVGIGAALKVLGIDVPEWIYPILGALGLGAIRSSIGKIEPPK